MNLNEKETSIAVGAMIAQMQRLRDFLTRENLSEDVSIAIQTEIQNINYVINKLLK